MHVKLTINIVGSWHATPKHMQVARLQEVHYNVAICNVAA